jgi:hypothetical protein
MYVAGRSWLHHLSIGIVPLAFVLLNGCQLQSVSTLQMEIHQARVDRDGLSPVQSESQLEVTCAPPEQWIRLPLSKSILYTHQQWRSPDRHVGMGVAHLRTPLPFSAEMVIWFARNQFTQSQSKAGKSSDGRLIAEWTDSLGRCWFEAENATYHVKGYAMTHGFDAWIVYSGYRVKFHPYPEEIELAQRSANTVAPLTSSQ